MIRALLIDLDDTLLDFKKTEQMALRPVLDFYGIEPSEEIIALYSKINLSYWKRLEKKELTREEIITKRWEEFFSHFNIKESGARVNELYFENLRQGAYLLNNAINFLEKASKKFDLFIVTNGIKNVQMNRLKKAMIVPYFKDIFISEEIGFNKPDSRFFDFVLDKVGYDKSEIMVIGDSLTSDIQGAINSNLDYIYFNPSGEKFDGKHVKDLMEIFAFID